MARKKSVLMCLAAACAAAAVAALMLWSAGRRAPPVADAAPAVETPVTAVARSSAAAAPVAADPSAISTTDIVVGKNDTMDAIFHRLAWDKADLAAIRSLPGVRQHLDLMKPGDTIRVSHDSSGAIQELSRKVGDTQTLAVVRENSGFAVHWSTEPVEVRIRTAAAVIDASLFQAAGSAEISDNVALKLASVFAWDIDFVLDIRSGDRFTAVYEQIYQNGKYLRDGEVLAAEFFNDGRRYRAIRYIADGAAGYYTPDGKPMRKAFLRAPLDFTRVSSVFAANRLHPILNLIRGHMGTDYAAPIGTPVHAAGDGHVSFEGLRGGYGNAIVLLHNSSVSTLYGHMSRFAKNIHVGSHVSQGEVIGYVGMTGLATGPHLHYEFLMNGVHMNPQTVRLPGAEPLRTESLDKFRETAGPLTGRLDAAGPGTASVGAAVGGTPVANAPVASTGSLAGGGESPSKTAVN